MSDQLEVISPSGDIVFYPLDAAHGITNIGRNPANDVVLYDGAVADFAATLDHRQKPYVLMSLADDAGVRINGVSLVGHAHREVHGWTDIEIGSHALVIIEEATSAESTSIAPVAPLIVAATAPAATAPADHATPPTTSAAPVVAAAAMLLGLGPPIPTQLSDIIVTELLDRVQTADVEQTVNWQLTIINGSRLVSRFEVRVEGWVDETWVEIDQDVVNLNEGGRATVNIAITPPRLAGCLAGAHHLAFVVTSPTHPEERARQSATLMVNPFYDYALDAPEPTQQTIPYRKRFALYELPIHNRGNSQVAYRIEASDPESGCRFEFLDPPHVYLGVREVRLGPNQETNIPLRVTPLKRRMIAAGARTYMLRIVAAPVEGVTFALPVQGELRHRPLFGRWILLLAALLLAVALLIIFSPRIASVSYTYVEPITGVVETSLSQADKDEGAGGYIDTMRSLLPFGLGGTQKTGNSAPDVIVRAGEPVTVTWRTSNGTILYLRPINAPGSERIIQDPFAVRSGSMGLAPQPNVDQDGNSLGPTNYLLRIENWMLRLPLIGALGVVERPFSINVIPADAPIIRAFDVSTNTTVAGNPVTISWDVDKPNASDTLALEEFKDGAVVQTILLADEVGSLVLTPSANTQFRLVSNTKLWTGQEAAPTRVQNITINTPTPTPVPSPAVRQFIVAPQQVVAGQPITITYNISGSTSNVLRLPGFATPEVVLEFPQGQISAQVPETGIYSIILDALRLPGGSTNPSDPAGARARVVSTVVAIAPTPTQTPTPTLTPTLTPQAPNIQVLELSPKEIVRGDTKDVTLTWNVIGDADEIVVSAPDFTITSTKKQETISVPTDKTRVFVLTVLLGSKPAASKSTELKVNEPPTATPLPPPTDTPVPPPPSATPIPLPLIAQFEIVSKMAGFPVSRTVNEGLDVFTVDAGVEVDVVWEVQTATSAELQQTPLQAGSPTDYKNRLTKDAITFIATEATRFKLTGINNPEGGDNDQTTERLIELRLNPVVVPDPPINVNYAGGLNTTDPVTVTWEYNAAQTDRIEGFRLYRAPAGSSDFLPIADETILKNDARSFTDADKNTAKCNKAYYLVAVFVDLTKSGTDKTVETNSGATSYQTPPCP